MRNTLRVLAAGLLLATAPAVRAQHTPNTEDPAPEPPAETAERMLTVEMAKLGTGVEERELVGESSTFGVGEKAWLWLHLLGGPADPITVTWTSGEDTYSTELDIGASRWRTWAYKTLWRAGEWSVTVVDANGSELHTQTFVVEMPTTPAEPEPEPEAKPEPESSGP
jgi:hypothetical protein